MNGGGAQRAPHILNVTVPGVDGQSFLMALDLHGIACSGGSACQSGSTGGSHVLTAIDPSGRAGASVRMSVGVLTTSNVVFNSFTRFEVELNGTMPGLNHDQLDVHGTVTLNNSQIIPLLGPALSAGMVIRILNNDGAEPIVGTFASLPEGATLTNTNGPWLRINYTGGDGNDVELRVLNPPPVVDSIVRQQATGFIQIEGHGLPNLLYTLEASTTLLPGSWVPVAADLVDSNGLFDLLDVDSTNHPMRFYRVLSP